MENEFATEDIRNVFSKILEFMDHSESETEAQPVKTFTKPEPSLIEKKEPVSEKPTKKISINKFNNTTLARMQARQMVVGEKLKKTALLLEQKQKEDMKFIPNINKNSQKVKIKPISKRWEGVIEEKKNKLSSLSEKINKERNIEIEKELTFRPNIAKTSDKPSRDFDQILENMKEWAERKQLRALIKKDEIEEKMKEILTFKPSLCENSVKLATELGEHKDVANRLYETKKPLVSPEFYSFVPEVSEKSKKLARNRSETQVFSRLYTSHKDLAALLNMVSPSVSNLIMETKS